MALPLSDTCCQRLDIRVTARQDRRAAGSSRKAAGKQQHENSSSRKAAGEQQENNRKRALTPLRGRGRSRGRRNRQAMVIEL
eukprot:4473667-Lingulodinium_polyedra.AAC.1